jgi:7-carboxy-7-deazaguanine synthase
MTGKINEIFQSLQGEGLYCGEKQIFVRFFGCNLNCRFCDTRLLSYKEYAAETLFEKIKGYGNNYHSVSFTGGEPLLQKDFLKEVLRLTHSINLKNYLETNGTLADELEDVIGDVDIISMDLKLPSSTGCGIFWRQHRRFLEIAKNKEHFLKAVICSDSEEKDLKQALELIREIDQSAVLVLQPDSYSDQQILGEKLAFFAHLCRQENITSYILPQMHKIIAVK